MVKQTRHSGRIYLQINLMQICMENHVSSKLMLTLIFWNLEQSSAPGRPDIVDYDNRSVDLKWTAPTVDGGVPIEKYIIEKKDKFV